MQRIRFHELMTERTEIGVLASLPVLLSFVDLANQGIRSAWQLERPELGALSSGYLRTESLLLRGDQGSFSSVVRAMVL